MRCPSCGKTIPDSVAHCAYCGGLVRTTDAAAPPRSKRGRGLAAVALLVCALGAAALLLRAGTGGHAAKPIRTLTGHTAAVRSVTFSADGRVLASGAADGTIRLWQVLDGSLLRTLGGGPKGITSVVFSPDGAALASGSGPAMPESWGQVSLWRVDDGSRYWMVDMEADGPSSTEVTVVAFSPDGSVLLAGTMGQGTQAHGKRGGVIQSWHMPSGTLLGVWETGAVRDLDLSPDGGILALAMADGVVELRRADGGELVRTLAHGDVVNGVAFSPNGGSLASAGGSAVKVWQAQDGRLLRSLTGISGEAMSAAFSPDGALLAAGTGNLGGGQVMIWQVVDGALLRTFSGHDRRVNSVAFSPDGSMLASGADDDNVFLWKVP